MLIAVTENSVPSPYQRGEYQASLSKQIIKDNKYRLKGATQRNGMTATSWQTWFVVASNIMEASPANSTHVRHAGQEGASCPRDVDSEAVQLDPSAIWPDDDSSSASSPSRRLLIAQKPQHKANSTKPSDQMAPCVRVDIVGSNRNGYVMRAVSEPMLESA